MRECGEPALGLEYVREYRNPRDQRAHPMYTCSLEGCKSSWGTSDDMFHHVIKEKHQKNYLKKMSPGDSRVAQLSKDQVLAEVSVIMFLFFRATFVYRQSNGRMRTTLMANVTTGPLFRSHNFMVGLSGLA